MDALLQEGFALMAEMDTVASGSAREGVIVKRLDELDELLGEDWWDEPSLAELFAKADAIGARC